MSDVSMQELELETAELLPSRETLHCWHGGGGSSTSVVGSFDHQNNLLGGNNVASGNSIALINFGGQSSSASAVGNGIGF
jgi:hypothetical protein